MVQCFTDATIALPIVAQGLSQRFKRFRRHVPRFHWNGADGLQITYHSTKL